MDIKEVIRAAARQEGVTEEEVRREIQKAIDQAWKTPKPMQKKLFPEGKPDVETFLRESDPFNCTEQEEAEKICLFFIFLRFGGRDRKPPLLR